VNSPKGAGRALGAGCLGLDRGLTGAERRGDRVAARSNHEWGRGRGNQRGVFCVQRHDLKGGKRGVLVSLRSDNCGGGMAGASAEIRP